MIRGMVSYASMAAVSAELYCPTQEDFDYGGNIQWDNNGWTMTGSGGVHAKTSWNLLDGYIEFDMDTSRANAGVNTNLYTTSPNYPGGSSYCDIQDNGHGGVCMEMDIVEMNGNCAGQATWHTWPNHNGDCDQGGCWGNTRISGQFKVRAEFQSDGWFRVTYNGAELGYTPRPSSNAQNYVRETMESKGATIESSQWVGWVPKSSECPGGGDLGSSVFSIRNLRVSGSVLKGKEPTKCSWLEESLTNATTQDMIAV